MPKKIRKLFVIDVDFWVLRKRDEKHSLTAVNKVFVHGGSIGLIWGKHARYVIKLL